MADVRVNGRRVPAMQAINTTGLLVTRLDTLGTRNGTVLTNLFVNGRQIDLDSQEMSRLKLDPEDTVEAAMESPQQLALESLQVAQEMAELLIFDIKVATLQLWDNTRYQIKSLETLVGDCKLLLTLGVRPVELLGADPHSLPSAAEKCLRSLDAIANNVEDATLLAVHSKHKDACQVLLARVLPAVERWLSLTNEFSRALKLGMGGENSLAEELALTPEMLQVLEGTSNIQGFRGQRAESK